MRQKIFALTMMVWLSPYFWAQADPGGNAQSKVLALESVWNQAEEKGDIGALDMIFDNSMIYVDEDGSLLTKRQFLVHAAKESGAHLQWLVTQTISVHVFEDTTVVVGNYRAKGMQGGKSYQRDGRFIDTWVFKKGTWVCVAAQATPILR
jgi:hypothetical protein